MSKVKINAIGKSMFIEKEGIIKCEPFMSKSTVPQAWIGITYLGSKEAISVGPFGTIQDAENIIINDL